MNTWDFWSTTPGKKTDFLDSMNKGEIIADIKGEQLLNLLYRC